MAEVNVERRIDEHANLKVEGPLEDGCGQPVGMENSPDWWPEGELRPQSYNHRN